MCQIFTVPKSEHESTIRGNALCVIGTVAHHCKLEEIYNLGTIPTQEDW